jgi:hypothetical protein
MTTRKTVAFGCVTRLFSENYLSIHKRTSSPFENGLTKSNTGFQHLGAKQTSYGRVAGLCRSHQMSTFTAISIASSISMPRYRTVLSILV